MPTVTYIEASGQRHEVNLDSGTNLMQGAVDNMIDGTVAECGGSCSCATCHCYIEESWSSKVEPASEIEKENSRLSCQINVTDSLDGLVVHLPESQF